MSTTPCCRTLMARGPSAEVTRCTCGHLHLSVGPVTIRMDEETLHATWHTVGEALQALSHGVREQPEPEATERGWKQ